MNKNEFDKGPEHVSHNVVKIDRIGKPDFSLAGQKTLAFAPTDWSNYEKTGNNAIDLVAQAIGYAVQRTRAGGPVLKTVILKPSSYQLFFTGLEVLGRKRLDPLTQLRWDGIPIIKGTWRQFESMQLDWYGPSKPAAQ